VIILDIHFYCDYWVIALNKLQLSLFFFFKKKNQFSL
jgi:hypothetical protein